MNQPSIPSPPTKTTYVVAWFVSLDYAPPKLESEADAEYPGLSEAINSAWGAVQRIIHDTINKDRGDLTPFELTRCDRTVVQWENDSGCEAADAVHYGDFALVKFSSDNSAERAERLSEAFRIRLGKWPVDKGYEMTVRVGGGDNGDLALNESGVRSLDVPLLHLSLAPGTAPAGAIVDHWVIRLDPDYRTGAGNFIRSFLEPCLVRQHKLRLIKMLYDHSLSSADEESVFARMRKARRDLSAFVEAVGGSLSSKHSQSAKETTALLTRLGLLHELTSQVEWLTAEIAGFGTVAATAIDEIHRLCIELREPWTRQHQTALQSLLTDGLDHLQSAFETDIRYSEHVLEYARPITRFMELRQRREDFDAMRMITLAIATLGALPVYEFFEKRVITSFPETLSSVPLWAKAGLTLLGVMAVFLLIARIILFLARSQWFQRMLD